MSPIESTVKKRKVKILLMFSGGVAHPVTFSDWVGPTVHCRPTLILPKYRVRASKKSQAAWTVRYELGTTLWRKSWGTAAAGFYESVHNSKSLSKLGCCVIYRCSHQQFGVCSPERERVSSLGAATKNISLLARHILESHFPGIITFQSSGEEH